MPVTFWSCSDLSLNNIHSEANLWHHDNDFNTLIPVKKKWLPFCRKQAITWNNVDIVHSTKWCH